jgi:hypothetical protein
MMTSLSELNRKILAHISRHGVGTIPSVNALLYDGKSPDTAKRALLRAKQAGLVTGFQVGRYTIYRLTARGAMLAQASRDAAAPIGAFALLQRLAVLAHCTLDQHQRLKLTREELANLVPGLVSSTSQHYALDIETGRLHRLTVDAGSGEVYLLKNARKMVQQACKTPLRALLEEGKFAVTILTPYPEKARRIASALQSDGGQRARAIQVEVLPEVSPWLI